MDWEDRLTIMDTLIYCRFYRDMVQWPYITAVVNATIGTDYTEEDLHRIANRIITMTHDFNAARGIGSARREKLPEWVTDKPMEDEERAHLPAGRDGVHARRVLQAARVGGAAAAGGLSAAADAEGPGTLARRVPGPSAYGRGRLRRPPRVSAAQ